MSRLPIYRVNLQWLSFADGSKSTAMAVRFRFRWFAKFYTWQTNFLPLGGSTGCWVASYVGEDP